MTPRCALPHFGAICEEIGETSWIKDVVEVHLQRACLFELDSYFITAKTVGGWEANLSPRCTGVQPKCTLAEPKLQTASPFMPLIYYLEQHQAQWLV